MEQRLIKKVLLIDGMSCTSCEMRIENALKKLEGIEKVKAVFGTSNVYITYDANVIKLYDIIQTIEKLGYEVKNKPDTPGAQKPNVKSRENETAERKMAKLKRNYNRSRLQGRKTHFLYQLT